MSGETYPFLFPLRTESSSGWQRRCDGSALSHLSPLHSARALPAPVLKRIWFERKRFVCKCLYVCACVIFFFFFFFLNWKHKLMHSECMNYPAKHWCWPTKKVHTEIRFCCFCPFRFQNCFKGKKNNKKTPFLNDFTFEFFLIPNHLSLQLELNNILETWISDSNGQVFIFNHTAYSSQRQEKTNLQQVCEVNVKHLKVKLRQWGRKNLEFRLPHDLKPGIIIF